MCGRYHFGLLPDGLGKKIKEYAKKLNLVYKEGEIFPSDNVLCVIPKETKITLSSKKWGIKGNIFQINARIESIENSDYYNQFKHKRCAVLCNGFYEWDKDKNKYYITFKEKYMYLACIFNDQDELLIITNEAYEEFKYIHDRMPVIMDRDEMLKYLHNEKCIFKKKEINIEKVNEEISIF